MATEVDSIFQAGSELGINIGWVSGNGQTILRLQQDRNLVLYKNNSPAYQAPNAYASSQPAVWPARMLLPDIPGAFSGRCQGLRGAYQRAGCLPPVFRKACTATGQTPRRRAHPNHIGE